MLVLSGISYRYAGYAKPVLHDIDLTLADGEILGVVGANDSGKSTLCLVASGLAVGHVSPHQQRDEDDVRALMRHPAMMAGSDGIFTGSRPHPRGCGCFARYLGHYVRETRTWTIEEAVQRLSSHAAQRFGLTDRGLLRPGMAADVVVFDPARVADLATYEDGRRLAVGFEHVLVNGEPVLLEGERTAARPGRALRPGR